MLNKQQQEVYDFVTTFNFDPINRKFQTRILIQGEAGTGKTYLLTEIIRALRYKSVIVTSTTHKSSKVLGASLPGTKVSTIHSVLGFFLGIDGRKKVLSSTNKSITCDVLIVDEVSMLPVEVYKKILEQKVSLVIFVGDQYQLPAVGNKAEIEVSHTFTLTQQMRQSNDSVLKEFMQEARNNISLKKIKMTSEIPSSILIYKDHKSFCKAYNECATNDKRILAYTNAVVDKYNENINRKRFKVGDTIIIDHPLHDLKNGDEVIIKEVKEGSTDDEPIELKVVTDESEYCCKYTIKVFKNKTKEEKYILSKGDLTDEEYWKLKDSIFRPKHLYASTIHKAQGMSIDEVFIDLRDLLTAMNKSTPYSNKLSREDYARLFYVAISRMKSKCHIFVGDTRDYSLLNIKKNTKKIKRKRVNKK